MQMNITGHQVELTEALKDYVNNKFDKLERHFDSISNVQVTLSIQKQRQIAEATMHISGADLHANAEHEDMYASIDALVDKLDRQILKHKEKHVDRMHGASAR
ncbi:MULTISPECIES: ribosome hibernation-promoting factor, HPF/YfiA family [Hahella]|uniref:Ribosome hibernation promoting factor n=1 Tax=Hahella chejuensis (strain KCTC 2396) TaxID=349521 RepID=Q2SBI0_HAHCH|nr:MULTISPECIES: ribosome-associated translation inhibitor RaiA [Hahella]ABC31994.1 Ribosome-associated protein Y (PSrp-1) [Hahella chejuensis KCTC 2396]AZZ90854.1 ribosome-associated translation inhibitor RaiA [Hahella sp. KA22]MBU6949996.1 ribosome-associated translation inhibitor RaiA [Hahella sp. HN01]MDG9668211.1 ribosome-associated translation inhibitor RaiA [Hahella sp. CR1]QAY54224.1 ribosome-associated translation inhibitor RaiA [Hahella sp. KA22]